MSTFCPSTKPASFSPRLNAATLATESVGDLPLRNPTTGIDGCCARADSGRGMANAAIPLMRSRRRFAFLKDYRSALTVAYRNAITAGIYDRRNGVLQSSNPEPLDVRFGSI